MKSNWKRILGWASRLAPAVVLAGPLLAATTPAGPPEWFGQFEPGPKVVQAAGGPFLGVGVKEVDAERSKALKLKDDYGVEITIVEADSPAAKAGLKVGDVVLEFNGQRVDGSEQFVRLIKETPVGRTVKILVHRGRGTQTVAATMGTRAVRAFAGTVPMEGFRFEVPRAEAMMLPDVPKTMMSWRSGLLGVEAEALGGSQLAGYFGVKEGVLVRAVFQGTLAEKAGLRPGDVLVKVDESKVTAPRDVTSAVINARSNAKASLPLVVMRDKREVGLTVVFEDDGEPKPAARSQRITAKP